MIKLITALFHNFEIKLKQVIKINKTQPFMIGCVLYYSVIALNASRTERTGIISADTFKFLERPL